MSVTDPDVIDAIGTDRQSGDVILMVSDHLDWGDDHAEHAVYLERKLARYLDFITSGQLLTEYPTATDRSVGVEVILKYRPDGTASAWLQAARRDYDKRGYRLTWRTLDE